MNRPLVDRQCKETVYLTPEYVLDCARNYFGGPILLDPATEPDNPTKATKFFTEPDDGLSRSWDYPVFINPPYGKTIKYWCAKIHQEASRGQTIIALMPCGARFSTKYWQNHMLVPELKAVCFVNHRVAFKTRDGMIAGQNLYDSQILGMSVDSSKFCDSFFPLGKCLKIDSVISGPTIRELQRELADI